MLFFIGIGLLVELIVKRRLLARHFQVDSQNIREMNQAERLKASVSHALPDFIGLCLFFGTSFASFVLFDPTRAPVVQLVFLAVLITISLTRSASILLHILLSPGVHDFRLLPIDCQTARIIHRLMVSFIAYIIAALMLSIVIDRLGAERQSIMILNLFIVTLLLTVAALTVLILKNRVRCHILVGGSEQNKCWGRKQLASVWHILAILYLALLWVLSINSIASPDQHSKGAFLVSFFVLPIWLIADRISQWIVLYAMSTLKIHQSHYDDTRKVSEEILLDRKKGQELYLKMNQLARAAVVIALFVWLAGLWDIKIPFISSLAAVLLDALVIMTLALIFWRFISTWIEKKIEESLPDEKEEEKQNDDEWGSAAARGRSYTLLPMVRKFIASILVVMVTMTILSSMGVDIGPLLAGAGVVGLAVGFGAQKLVSDMFSGFFYLLDDAFRVGEYVTAGSVSGTVESISLRNVMLRHHRGMLQIVPHSELGAITNFMRGGIVVKFNLDFPYDADIDKIRKTIKKVGIAMLDDEELGKDFIRPVKSQGVREITNSVMTIRVKFTAKPGAHFVIRREAYKRITEALNRNGIYYAHKKVIVDVPGLNNQDNSPLSPEQTKAISNSVGAAALASLDEEQKGVKEEQKGQM